MTKEEEYGREFDRLYADAIASRHGGRVRVLALIARTVLGTAAGIAAASAVVSVVALLK